MNDWMNEWMNERSPVVQPVTWWQYRHSHFTCTILQPTQIFFPEKINTFSNILVLA
jgi:hypothetical protein